MLGNFLSERSGGQIMARQTPRVSCDRLYDPRSTADGIRLDSTEWWAWLAAPTTTSFAYPCFDPSVGYIVGFVTVRKERRQRGGAYWVAYRRIDGQLRKAYLGAAQAVTAERLAVIATAFQRKGVVHTDA